MGGERVDSAALVGSNQQPWQEEEEEKSATLPLQPLLEV